ncbi:hypothetical protein SeLEV6574_g04634 [Synchytrium endobioticum]|uniref:Uncharacterized protein n=1 Tax=Synchytrium endobioticum TaxID=286115 RepID=A0A507CYR5_9FUNG|nr:hypothetical protein SeLEV6574_g04634 [Synchytrium endobioticum]
MVTITDQVDRAMLDLLVQEREDDNDAPPSVLIDFLGQADEQALRLSLGTHNPEEYEASTSRCDEPSLTLSSIHHHAAEYSARSHNDRSKGKRPLRDAGSSLSYPRIILTVA